jgi:uncharacterized cofD-like protein
MTRTKKVVVIGGGQGQSCILRGIKNIEDIEISAIVTVADDGGSTGRIRERYYMPAMGDIRNVMIALSTQESIFKTLMDFRFESNGDKDEDIAGHNLGNLILTALTQTHGSFMESITAVSKILNVKGTIIPSTYQVITLFARMEDGTIVKGEKNIPDKSNRIKKVFYQRKVNAAPDAIKAIEEADLVIYGIGSLYTSILPNIIIEDIQNSLENSKAKKIYFANCVSQVGETDNYTLEEHVDALQRHKAPLDIVIYANDTVPDEIIEKYEKEGSKLVKITRESHNYEIIEENLLQFDNDLIRHSPEKIEIMVKKLMKRID